jgi:hypothetical protein
MYNESKFRITHTHEHEKNQCSRNITVFAPENSNRALNID